MGGHLEIGDVARHKLMHVPQACPVTHDLYIELPVAAEVYVGQVLIDLPQGLFREKVTIEDV